MMIDILIVVQSKATLIAIIFVSANINHSVFARHVELRSVRHDTIMNEWFTKYSILIKLVSQTNVLYDVFMVMQEI